MDAVFDYFAISMTCVAIVFYGWLLVEDWRASKKEEEEVTLPDGRNIKVKIPPRLDRDYPWNRGKHWFFRSPYRGMSPFGFVLVILAVYVKYGWAGVGVIWIFVFVIGGIRIIISLFVKE